MKRLLALLLVLCMVFALGACGKKTDSPNSTGDSKNNAANNKEEKEETEWTYEHVVNTGNFNADELVTDTNNAAAVNKDILNNDDLINPEKFADKSLRGAD